MTTETQVTITIADDNGTSAPLFAQYQGQINPQPAYIEFDPRDDGLVLIAEYSGEIGNGMPGAVWHGIIRRYTVSCCASREALEGLADDSEVGELLARIKAGYKHYHDGANWAGSLTEDAQEAEEALERLLEELDQAEIITDLASWLADGGRDCWMPGEQEDVAAYIAAFDLGDYDCAEDAGEVLVEMWANQLYSGEPMQQNVARYLLDSGHCSDSQWVEELNAYAEGRTPE